MFHFHGTLFAAVLFVFDAYYIVTSWYDHHSDIQNEASVLQAAKAKKVMTLSCGTRKILWVKCAYQIPHTTFRGLNINWSADYVSYLDSKKLNKTDSFLTVIVNRLCRPHLVMNVNQINRHKTKTISNVVNRSQEKVDGFQVLS